MLITTENLTDMPELAEIVTPSDFCFVCGMPLVLPCVMWAGHSGEIWMHPPCSTYLSQKLSEDANSNQ